MELSDIQAIRPSILNLFSQMHMGTVSVQRQVDALGMCMLESL